MNHPVLDASPYIDAILGGRFIRSCQPETILLLGLGTNEPQVNQPILWGVRGAESKISNPPKLGQKVRKKCIFLHAFFSFTLAVHEWTGQKVQRAPSSLFLLLRGMSNKDRRRGPKKCIKIASKKWSFCIIISRILTVHVLALRPPPPPYNEPRVSRAGGGYGYE